jgi:hypothetical protein
VQSAFGVQPQASHGLLAPCLIDTLAWKTYSPLFNVFFLTFIPRTKIMFPQYLTETATSHGDSKLRAGNARMNRNGSATLDFPVSAGVQTVLLPASRALPEEIK